MKEKLPAGLLGIFLGCLGIHKFYLGYTKEGIITLVITLFTFGIGASIMAVIGLIEGILHLIKDDEEFQNTYVYGHKGWF
ncbi:MAG TPA: TM2 domain-containing protein [Ruminococcus sp.]|nr:TM2 domain-containing protein [Ruminococcus sp.]